MAMCLAATLLAGCSLTDPPAHKEVVKQALPEKTSVPPQWSSPADADTVANDWLKSFNDPAMEALVAEAMQNNLDLRQAAAVVEMARQTVTVVGAQLYPQIGAKVGGAGTISDTYAPNSQSDNDSFFGAGYGYAGVYWELDVWGKLRAQREATVAKYQASALEFAFARQSLAATVAKSWYLAVETAQLLELAEKSVRIYTDLRDLVQVRQTAGKVTELDVAEANANLNTALSALAAARSNYSEARRNLERILGRYPAAEVAVARNFVPVPPPVKAGLPVKLLERRPDLVAAEKQVLAAFRQQEAAKLNLLPSFALTLDAGRISDGLTSLLRIVPWLLHGTIGMDIPLYMGGALRAKVEIATARQKRVVASYGSALLKAFYEVEVTLTNESSLAAQLQKELKAFGDYNDAVRLATIRYQAGAGDLLSVLIMQEKALGSQSKVIQLRNARLANRINLHLALGGGFGDAPATVQ